MTGTVVKVGSLITGPGQRYATCPLGLKAANFASVALNANVGIKTLKLTIRSAENFTIRIQKSLKHMLTMIIGSIEATDFLAQL